MSFRNDVFARPGVIAATSGLQNATDLRAGGAQTVYWWMKLNKLAGTPSAPLDPATIPDAVADVFSKAVAATGCETPLIVLNELNSAGTTTPWTDTNAQYRANVLDVLRRLVERGALPVLLISARPYTGGDAVGVVAAGKPVGDARARGVLPGAAGDARGRGRRQPHDAPALPRRRRAPESDRHPGRSSRCRRRVPVGTGQGRPRGPQADDGLAAAREARGAGRKTGRGRARAGNGRQLGLGDVRPGGGGRGQGEGGLRLPLGARPCALRRPGFGRPRLQGVRRRGADRASGRPALLRRRPRDLASRTSRRSRG